MSHLSCSTTLSSSPNIYYTTSSVLIISRSGSDIPTRLDVSPWNLSCSSVAFNQITSLKVQILDCSSYNTSFLVNFTKLTNLDLEFVDQPISSTWFDTSTVLQSLTLRNINPVSHSGFLSKLCATKYYNKLLNLQIDNLSNTVIPQCVFHSSTQSMVSLELSNMRNVSFQPFDANIKMIKLKTLNFSSNALVVFPPKLEAIYLKVLDVSNNKLMSLEKNEFPNLLTLIANNNSLAQIPTWFYLGNENDLLDLSYNPMTDYVASDIFVNAEVRLSGNSWLIDYGNIDCSYSVGLLIMDDINVKSINAIAGCSNDLRLRNANITDPTGLRTLMSSKNIDISFSPNYFKILLELCMDSGTAKTITIHKNVTLPNICTNNTNTALTVNVDPNCGYLNNLRNLTVGVWNLNCVEPSIVIPRICIKYVRETSYTLGTTSRKLVYNSMKFYSSMYSSLSYTKNATVTASKQVFKWIEATQPSLSSYFTRAKNLTSLIKNATSYYNYTGNSTLRYANTSQNTTIMPKFHFEIMDPTTIISNKDSRMTQTSTIQSAGSNGSILSAVTKTAVIPFISTGDSTKLTPKKEFVETTRKVDPNSEANLLRNLPALNAYILKFI